MPWFKQGTHDRIFSSCGCGALCLTDSSFYLNNILKDDVNVGIYKLENLSVIPEKINDYLNNPDKAKEIINNGFKLAEENSWYKRADCINNIIQKVNINGGNKC